MWSRITSYTVLWDWSSEPRSLLFYFFFLFLCCFLFPTLRACAADTDKQCITVCLDSLRGHTGASVDLFSTELHWGGGHPHEVCTASGHLHACEQPSGEELTCTPDSQPTMKAKKRWSWGAIVTVGNVPERERRGECVCCVGVCSTWTHSRVRMREWARRGERARIEMCQWKPNEGGGCAANYSPGSPLMWQPWHRC